MVNLPVIKNLNEIEVTFCDNINVYENPPEGIDIENYSEDELTEGILEAEPTEIRLLFKINEKDIPKSISIHKTFTPWYANDKYMVKTHGYGCDVGVDVKLSLINVEHDKQGFIGTYFVSDIQETG